MNNDYEMINNLTKTVYKNAFSTGVYRIMTIAKRDPDEFQRLLDSKRLLEDFIENEVKNIMEAENEE